MEIISVTPVLVVKDVQATLKYYKKHFSFLSQGEIPGHNKSDWAVIYDSAVIFMLQSLSSFGRRDWPPSGGATFYVTVRNIRAIYAKLEKTKTKIIEPLILKSYGATEFSIEDCNGYVLTFAEYEQGAVA
jgi:uncharacterized glyoxalase superfamily protein PhnB